MKHHRMAVFSAHRGLNVPTLTGLFYAAVTDRYGKITDAQESATAICVICRSAICKYRAITPVSINKCASVLPSSVKSSIFCSINTAWLPVTHSLCIAGDNVLRRAVLIR